MYNTLMAKPFEKINRILAWVMGVHSLVFVVFWLTNTPFHQSVNYFISEQVGFHLDFVLLPILLFAFMGVWSLARILFAEKFKQVLRGRAAFFALCVFFLILFYALFAILFSLSSIQFPRLVQLFNFFRPIFEIPILILLVVLTLPMVAKAFRLRKERPPYAVALVSIWIFVWSFSLWSPPDSVYRGKLPEKPMLVAHRGASQLAPENTLSAVSLAAQVANRGVTSGSQGLVFNDHASALGVETDIRVSLDGTLFLMHDATLKRTTNVAGIFPGRVNDNASLFTLPELKQLNAGAWFMDAHPLDSLPAGLVSAAQYQAYATEPVATLQDWLKVVKANHLVFIFDLLPPPEGHPYFDRFFNLAFEQINNAGIDDQVWFLVDEADYWKVHAAAGQMHLAYGADYHHPPEVATLQSLSYEIVNSEYGLPVHWLREYQAAHIKVNLWTVDEPWQFSRLWVLGVNSVTTNNLATFASESFPVIAIPYRVYAAAWGILGLLMAAYVYLRGRKY